MLLPGENFTAGFDTVDAYPCQVQVAAGGERAGQPYAVVAQHALHHIAVVAGVFSGRGNDLAGCGHTGGQGCCPLLLAGCGHDSGRARLLVHREELLLLHHRLLPGADGRSSSRRPRACSVMETM